ncbi:hypothetical protein AMECASPLE_023991, partial [Ameca splendens]
STSVSITSRLVSQQPDQREETGPRRLLTGRHSLPPCVLPVVKPATSPLSTVGGDNPEPAELISPVTQGNAGDRPSAGSDERKKSSAAERGTLH